MANLQEIGVALHQVFGEETDLLLGMTHAAAEQVQCIQGQFGAVVSGGENPHIHDIYVHLAAISEMLGALATRVGATRETAQELLADWGIEPLLPAGTLPTITIERSDGPTEVAESAPSLLGPESQARLSTQLEQLIPPKDSEDYDLGMRTVKSLMAGGVRDTRDAFLLGAVYLGKMRNVGPTKIKWLRQTLAGVLPEVPLTQRPDPTLAARLCPSLHEVPLEVLGGINLRQLSDKVSVHDLLHRLPGELFAHQRSRLEASYSPELTDSDLRFYAVLLRKAEAYAAQFEQAQRAQ